MDLVLKLRELRRMRGLSQEEVSKRSGVHVKTISSFESGSRIESIKVSQLARLLTVYGITLAEFFGDGVERRAFGEFEHLTESEARLIRELRDLPDTSRTRLEEKFLAMLSGVEVITRPRPLRAVR